MHRSQKTERLRPVGWIRRNLPARYESLLINIVRYIQAIFYIGNRYECPCCGWKFRRMLTFGAPPRPNAKCPRCHSLERHRWLILYLRKKTASFQHPHTLLHFAPEPSIRRNLVHNPNIVYYTTDLINTADYQVDVRTDISQLAVASNAIDVILCNHVLEHIPDDRSAMRQLFRVLKPDGWMVVSVPIRHDQPTYEDASIQSPSAREVAFGQHDHVRFYGYDFPDRLRETGFTVNIERVEAMDAVLIQRYQLRTDEVFFIASKPR